MILGHFAMAPAAKPLAPKMPMWALIVATQFLDVFFLIFLALGWEGVLPDGKMDVYAEFKGDIQYTHSLVGALIISALAFWIGKRFWETNRNGWILAGLSFSHWPLDVLVHFEDMPILPGNWGGLPMLGFAAWKYPGAILATEITMGVAGLALYTVWARKQPRDGRWYTGPAAVAAFFALVVLSNVLQYPR